MLIFFSFPNEAFEQTVELPIIWEARRSSDVTVMYSFT